jgi:hypothetical protein
LGDTHASSTNWLDIVKQAAGWLREVGEGQRAADLDRASWQLAIVYYEDSHKLIKRVIDEHESPGLLVPLFDLVFPDGWVDSDRARSGLHCLGSDDMQVETFERIAGVVAASRSEAGTLVRTLCRAANAAYTCGHNSWPKFWRILEALDQQVRARGSVVLPIDQYWRERGSIDPEFAIIHILLSADVEKVAALKAYDSRLLAAQRECGYGFLCCACACFRNGNTELALRFLSEATQENSVPRGDEKEFQFHFHAISAVIHQQNDRPILARNHYEKASDFIRVGLDYDPVMPIIVNLGVVEMQGRRMTARWFDGQKRSLPDNHCLLSITKLKTKIDDLRADLG